MAFFAEHTYLITQQFSDERLFTAVLLPFAGGRFPTVVIRTPYVDALEAVDEESICARYLNQYSLWLARGYAVVLQHCRGKGKSDGTFIPYRYEREDTRALYAWIRLQGFYNGELFLKGESYLTSVHYLAAPFDADVKGAVFSVQDTERYNLCYRNGCFKKALHGNWFVGVYKAKSKLKKHYTAGSFETLPLTSFSQTVFGEAVEEFDQMLRSPNKSDAFWRTPAGGSHSRGITDAIGFPVLFTTGFYDIYTGGIFEMWNQMCEDTKKRCALVVSPNDHNDRSNAESSIAFPNSVRRKAFGEAYDVDWFDHIRKGSPAPFEKGKVTYYSLFENRWRTDAFLQPKESLELPLGEDTASYTYNPYDPPRFLGGLSCNFGGSCFQAPPHTRHDVVSVYTKPFSADALVKGRMTATLCVASDCEDTCFYVRVSLETLQGDFGLRDDVTTLCYQLGDYTPNTPVKLQFSFDEHAFLVRRGQRLRVDIASADAEHYVRHTNQKGLYCEQETAKIAHNTLFLGESRLMLPIETDFEGDNP